MATSAVRAIPAPLTGIPFLKATHLQLGDERWAPASAWQSFSHSQFPLLSGVCRPAPAPRPLSGGVLRPAGDEGGEACSETRLAFPERPLQPVVAPVLPESHIHMHADPRICVLTSAMRQSFPCPHTPRRTTPLPAAERQEHHIPCGDREKIRLLSSEYTYSYPAHGIQPAARHLPMGSFPTITGGGQTYYHTSYQAQFKGEWSPPPKPSEKHMSCIKFGDAGSSGAVSEQKHAYSAPDKRPHRAYDKEHAASQIHHTHLQLGDGCTRFSTLMSELFPGHSLEPVSVVHPNKYASSIPRGDEDPERNQASARTTTTKLSYPETDRWSLPPKPVLLKQQQQSNFSLGDECSGSCSFSTTQQADYQPPQQSQRVMADSRSHHKSHIPFNYHTAGSSVTTTQAMLVPHRQKQQGLSKDKLQQIKCSHLELPWRAKNLFRTEQKEQFTPKTRGPAEILKADLQGTLISQTERGHKKVL